MTNKIFQKETVVVEHFKRKITGYNYTAIIQFHDGEQFHHLIAAPIAEGATFDEAIAFLSSEEPPEGPPPVDFGAVQDLAVIGPGTSQTADLNLEAGSYVFMCFLTDRTGGPPHFTQGMAVQVDIT